MGRAAYAMMLDVTERQVVVVGGGSVAARKVTGLLEAGARSVRVVSPVVCDSMPEGAERILSAYQPEHLAGAELVFAATDDPAVNAQVAADARKIGAWVSRVDGRGENSGDFTRPAVWRNGNLSIAVSTTCAPILSRRIRDAVGRWVDPRWTAMAMAMERVRPVVHGAGLAAERRREIFRTLCDEEALETAAQKGTEGVLEWLAGRYPELKK